MNIYEVEDSDFPRVRKMLLKDCSVCRKSHFVEFYKLRKPETVNDLEWTYIGICGDTPILARDNVPSESSVETSI